MGGIGGVGARQGVVSSETMKYEEGRPDGSTRTSRIPDMDLDCIDAAFLYPRIGLFAGAVHDPNLSAALCRAYNRWLTGNCKPDPDRLFGIAMLPMQVRRASDPGDEVCAQGAGHARWFLEAQPYNDRLIHDPVYEPFWSAAEEVDFSIGFHEGGSSGMPTVGIDRFERRAAKHIISHTMEMMLGSLSIIWGADVERHPKLRVAFLEPGGGTTA